MLMRIVEFLDDWYFSYDGHEEELVKIPHTHTMMPPNYLDAKAYQFKSLYRKSLSLAPRFKGERFFLTFDGVATTAKVFVNDELIFHHEGGYTPFEVEIPSGDIELKVEVDGAEQAHIPPFGGVIDYLTYAGMYREVYLKRVSSVYIENIFVRGSASKVIDVDVTLSSTTSVDKLDVMISHEKNVVRAIQVPILNQKVVHLTTLMKQAKLWDLEHPYLYTVEVRLKKGDEVIDVASTRFGFRDAQFRSDGFYLNDQLVKLVGLSRHQCYPGVGDAMPRLLQERDAEILKQELGLNMVRTSHYPQSKHFLNRCDELGLLVFEEVPGWQSVGESESWHYLMLQNVQDMILRDRNHPSIVLWGVRVNDSSDHEALYTKANLLAHDLDPTRQTGGGGQFGHPQFFEDVYTFDDFSNAPLLSTKKVVKDSKIPYLVSAHTGHMYPTKRYDNEEQRLEQAMRHVKVMNKMMGSKRISGAIGCCLFDYPTHMEFGSGDGMCYHGVLDFNRIPKLSAFVYASQQEKIPVMEVGTSFNIGEHAGGILGPIYVFTNCDYVNLFKNDVLIKGFYPNHREFKYLKHPPILIDDLIGDMLQEEEGMTKWDANNVKKVLMASSMHGMILPPRYKLRMAIAILRYGISVEEEMGMYGKYVGNLKDSHTVYRLEGYKGGQLVKTKCLGSVRNPRLVAKADYEVVPLHETYEINRIVVQVRCENGNVLPYAFDSLRIETLGPIELVGHAPAIVGGAAAIYVKTTGKGMGDVMIRSGQFGDCEVEFAII